MSETSTPDPGRNPVCQAESLYRGSRHRLPVRRPNFAFDDSIPRHWIADNALATHIFNGLQMLFPAGERFFIRSVKAVLAEVEDQSLCEQARAFSIQEAMHTREHEHWNLQLEAQGYRFRPFLKRFERMLGLLSRYTPKSLQLAITAGTEHYTALLGTIALTQPILRDQMHPLMEQLIVWHACEEVEHKAVAFDVMQAVGIGYPTRILGYLLATAMLLTWSISGTRLLLRQDGLSRRDVRALAEALPHKNGARLRAALGAGFRTYFRRDFHPNESDGLLVARRELAAVGLDPISDPISDAISDPMAPLAPAVPVAS
jgi:predicted metal-dependent hydrolase